MGENDTITVLLTQGEKIIDKDTELHILNDIQLAVYFNKAINRTLNRDEQLTVINFARYNLYWSQRLVKLLEHILNQDDWHISDIRALLALYKRNTNDDNDLEKAARLLGIENLL